MEGKIINKGKKKMLPVVDELQFHPQRARFHVSRTVEMLVGREVLAVIVDVNTKATSPLIRCQTIAQEIALAASQSLLL